ncbi:hypothetical protein TNCV_3305671 [Trichonephila clavipes]|nr:hypothetical protein TNCV_3305671 [Trichonephila clavipes]
MSQLGCVARRGKVQLPEIETPPEPLNGLLIGTDPDSNVFLKVNSKIQFMLSNDIVRSNRNNSKYNANGQEFNSTFKIQRPSLS